MELLGIAGFVFAATALSVLVYEHQTDVLHGPYIEGRAAPRGLADIAFDMLAPLRALADPFIDRIKWNARGAIYLASLA